MMICVEFFGIVRRRAGVERAHLEFDGEECTLGQVVQQLGSDFPHLIPECVRDGHLAPGLIANIDGRKFCRDARTRLKHGQSVIVLSVDAGG